MIELTNKKLLNLQEEYFMKKFIKKITMHQYDLVSRMGDDRPAFLPSARGRGPPLTRK